LVRRKRNRKAVWRRRLTLIVVLALVALGCFQGPWAYREVRNWWGSKVRFPLRSVRVEGVTRLAVDTVLSRTTIPIGASMLALDLTRMRIEVESNPWIDHAHVFRRFPSTLVIRIEEVKPLLLIAGNPLGVVGANGKYLGHTWHGTTWDLPMLSTIDVAKLDIGQPVTTEGVMALINCALDISNKAPDVYQMISDFYLKNKQIMMNLSDGQSRVRVPKDAAGVNWDVLREFMLRNRQDFADQDVEIDLRFPQWVIVSPIKG